MNEWEKHDGKTDRSKFCTSNIVFPQHQQKKDDHHNKIYQGDLTTDWSEYNDNLELFFEDKDNPKITLNMLHQTFHHYPLTINVPNTKTMVINYRCISNDNSSYPESIATQCIINVLYRDSVYVCVLYVCVSVQTYVRAYVCMYICMYKLSEVESNCYSYNLTQEIGSKTLP